jgi:hypothetical protein
MSTVLEKKQKSDGVAVVKKMKNYGDEPVFKKKEAKAAAFLNKHGVPKASGRRKK